MRMHRARGPTHSCLVSRDDESERVRERVARRNLAPMFYQREKERPTSVRPGPTPSSVPRPDRLRKHGAAALKCEFTAEKGESRGCGGGGNTRTHSSLAHHNRWS